MKEFKRSLSVLMAGIMTAALFTGCNDSENKDDFFSETENTEKSITSLTSVTELKSDILSETQTTTVTTAPPHISPKENLSYSSASEKGQINEILDHDTNKTYKASLGDFADEGDRIESFTFVIYSEDGISDIGKFNGAFGISVTEDCPAATDNYWYQSDDVEISVNGAYAEIKWDIPAEIKDYINIGEKSFIQIGYWWGDVQKIRLESIICNYSKSFEIPVDETKTIDSGAVLKYKDKASKTLKIPFEELISDDTIPQYFEINVEGGSSFKKISGAFGVSLEKDCPSATDENWYQSRNFAVFSDSANAVLYWKVPDEIRDYIDDDGDFMLGFWWSETESITVKNITVKSSIKEKEPVIQNDSAGTPEGVLIKDEPYKSIIPSDISIQDISSQQIVDDMRIGINIGNSLDCYDPEKHMSAEEAETFWGNPLITKETVDTIKKAGFNAVRIPVSWTNHISEDNIIDSEWLDRVNEVVNYVIDNDMYAIINVHHDDYTWLNPSKDDEEEVRAKFVKIWEQISERFKDYDYHLLFEGMNEPRIVGSDNEWIGGTPEEREVINDLFEAFVETVRNSGGNNVYRHLIITSHAASITGAAVKAIKIPDDGRIIVSIHYYSPWSFSDPDDNSAKAAVWGSDSDKLELEKGFNFLKTTFVDNGIPVIIGEFGSVNKKNYSTRAEYTEYYIETAKKCGITCFMWDEGSKKNFGMLNRKALTWFFPDIISEAVDAAEIEDE